MPSALRLSPLCLLTRLESNCPPFCAAAPVEATFVPYQGDAWRCPPSCHSKGACLPATPCPRLLARVPLVPAPRQASHSPRRPSSAWSQLLPQLCAAHPFPSYGSQRDVASSRKPPGIPQPRPPRSSPGLHGSVCPALTWGSAAFAAGTAQSGITDGQWGGCCPGHWTAAWGGCSLQSRTR